MRTILFRAKRVDNGEWVEGFPFTNPKWGNSVYFVPAFDYFCTPAFQATKYIEVHPETVGQYTGLKDKNGKMIFEGDKVQIEYIDIGKQAKVNKSAEVIYNSDEYAYQVVFDDNFTGWLCDYESGGLEIIGNIFDDKELLKGQDDDIR